MGKIEEKTERLLILEEEANKGVQSSEYYEMLQESRKNLISHVVSVKKSEDLNNIIGVEKAIIKGDLKRYANSTQMVNSLNSALAEIEVIQRSLDVVSDPKRYAAVDAAHRLEKNRKNGLPIDEARQSFKSHYTRLNNLDRSRLTLEEKALIEARKGAFFLASKLYTRQQEQTLGVEAKQKRGRKI